MRLCALLPIGLALLIMPACGGDDPPPHHVYPDGGGPKRDGYQPFWPDVGRQPDYGKPGDGTANSDAKKPGDGGSGGDGKPANCPGPTGAKCSSPCAADEVCTEAKGGTCVKRLILTGSVADKNLLRDVALAYVRCWAKAPADDLLCYAFDTCGMSGVLTEKAISDWVCSKAGITDFPSPADYDAARGLCRCSFWQGQFIYRPDWKIGSIISGKNGTVCMSYDKNPWYSFDKLNINDCQYFPPL